MEFFLFESAHFGAQDFKVLCFSFNRLRGKLILFRNQWKIRNRFIRPTYLIAPIQNQTKIKIDKRRRILMTFKAIFIKRSFIIIIIINILNLVLIYMKLFLQEKNKNSLSERAIAVPKLSIVKCLLLEWRKLPNLVSLVIWVPTIF